MSKGPSARTRTAVKERDGQCCRFCGTSRMLAVHHIAYRSEGGEHLEVNLITLCLSCHDRVHSDKRKWKPILVELLRLQYEEDLFFTVPQVERRMDSNSPTE